MLEVLPFGEDPDLSGTAGPAGPQHLPPCHNHYDDYYEHYHEYHDHYHNYHDHYYGKYIQNGSYFFNLSCMIEWKF